MEGRRSSGALRLQPSDLLLSCSAAAPGNTASRDPQAPPGSELGSERFLSLFLSLSLALHLSHATGGVDTMFEEASPANVPLLISCVCDDRLLGTEARIQSVMIFNSRQPAAVCCLPACRAATHWVSEGG